jgi:hypothetical protein
LAGAFRVLLARHQGKNKGANAAHDFRYMLHKMVFFLHVLLLKFYIEYQEMIFLPNNGSSFSPITKKTNHDKISSDKRNLNKPEDCVCLQSKTIYSTPFSLNVWL